jgi:hypothetical protein
MIFHYSAYYQLPSTATEWLWWRGQKILILRCSKRRLIWAFCVVLNYILLGYLWVTVHKSDLLIMCLPFIKTHVHVCFDERILIKFSVQNSNLKHFLIFGKPNVYTSVQSKCRGVSFNKPSHKEISNMSSEKTQNLWRNKKKNGPYKRVKSHIFRINDFVQWF